MKKHLIITLTIFLMAITLCGAVSATDDPNDVKYVSITGSDDNDGTELNPYLTICKGITSVNPNGTVNVADGTYYEHITISKNVNLVGQSQENTILDGSNTGRPLTINTGATVNISLFTICNGKGDYGGGIRNEGNLTVINSTIANNNAWAGGGGGIYSSYGTLLFSDSIVSSNTALYGGGIHNYYGTLEVTSSVINDNRATESIGGGILNEGTLLVSDSIFTGNIANIAGGGICDYIYKIGTLNINNSTFEDNNATNGGGIYNSKSILAITGSTIQDNNASQGGGIWNSGTSSISNSLISHNRASNSGGGIYNRGTVNVSGSTISSNTASEGGGIYNYFDTDWGNVTVSGSTISGNSATNGGGIYNYVCNVTVFDSTISGNSATNGGGIYNYDGILTVFGSTISGNSATNGGGIYKYYGTSSVSGSTISGNAASSGGGIYSYIAILTMNFNRIVDNSHTAIQNNDGTVDARYNWWGSNNPDFTTLISGVVDYNSWLYMNLHVNPNNIAQGETSTLTASFNNAFDGTTITPLDPIGGHIPDKTPVTFSTDLGSVGSKTIYQETSNGVATATLTADEAPGIAHVNAVTDSQTVNTNVNSKLSTNTTTENKNNIAGQNVELKAVVKDGEGNNVNEGQVRFTVDNVIVDTVDVVNGQATLNWAIPSSWAVGNKIILAEFLGTDSYGTSDGIANLTVNIKPTSTVTENKKNLPGQNVELKAIVKDDEENNVNEGQVRFTVNGIIVGTVNVVNSQAVLNWIIPSNWASGNKIILAEFLGTDNYGNSDGTANLTVDLNPAAWASIKGGLFNVNKYVYLNMNKPGTIYYTLNGATPTTASIKYTGYLTISSSTTLRFIGVDLGGNVSPVYTETYVIDKTTPKVVSIYPKNLSTGQSRTATLYLKFSESLKTSTYWSKIYVKDLKTGKKVVITKWIKGNILYIKTKYKRASLRSYQVYVPYKAVKDYAGNNLVKTFAYKFKTRS